MGEIDVLMRTARYEADGNMILDVLIVKSKGILPKFREEVTPDRRVIFPAVHPEVGDVEVFDDGDEIIVVVGNFTHRHFDNYDEELSDQQKADEISNNVIEFLQDLFSDRVIMWGSHDRGGGCFYRGLEDGAKDQRKFPDDLFPVQMAKIFGLEDGAKDLRKYVWSGPFNTSG